jgi:hypothetical protein
MRTLRLHRLKSIMTVILLIAGISAIQFAEAESPSQTTDEDPAQAAQKIHDQLSNTYQQINSLNPLGAKDRGASPVPITDPVAMKLQPLLQNPVSKLIIEASQGNLIDDIWNLISRIRNLQFFLGAEAGFFVFGLIALLFVGKKSGTLLKLLKRLGFLCLIFIIDIIIVPYFFMGVSWLDLVWRYLRPLLAQFDPLK